MLFQSKHLPPARQGAGIHACWEQALLLASEVK